MKTNKDLWLVSDNSPTTARLNVTLNFGDKLEPVDLPIHDICVDDAGDMEVIDFIIDVSQTDLVARISQRDWKYYTYCKDDYDDVEQAIRSGEATLIPNLLPSEVETAKKLIGRLNDEHRLNLRLAAVQQHTHVMEFDA